MNFKDIMRQDAKNVFLNEDEFGEKHQINGKEMCIVIDNNEMLDREKRYQPLKNGLHMQQMLFYVAVADFGRLPAAGQILEIDGHRYVITDAIREGAMYSISVEVHGS